MQMPAPGPQAFRRPTPQKETFLEHTRGRSGGPGGASAVDPRPKWRVAKFCLRPGVLGKREAEGFAPNLHHHHKTRSLVIEREKQETRSRHVRPQRQRAAVQLSQNSNIVFMKPRPRRLQCIQNHVRRRVCFDRHALPWIEGQWRTVGDAHAKRYHHGVFYQRQRDQRSCMHARQSFRDQRRLIGKPGLVDDRALAFRTGCR